MIQDCVYAMWQYFFTNSKRNYLIKAYQPPDFLDTVHVLWQDCLLHLTHLHSHSFKYHAWYRCIVNLYYYKGKKLMSEKRLSWMSASDVVTVVLEFELVGSSSDELVCWLDSCWSSLQLTASACIFKISTILLWLSLRMWRSYLDWKW